jgi:hypothetical protein
MYSKRKMRGIMTAISWTEQPGFPGLHQLNAKRDKFFTKSMACDKSWNSSNKPISFERVGCFIGHKFLTVVCVPANIIGAGVGIIGMYPVAWLVTAVKVAYKAITGNEAQFSSGRNYFEACTKNSLGHLSQNLKEPIYELGRAVFFVFERLSKGWVTAAARDVANEDMCNKTPYPISILNDWTSKSRINWEQKDRPLKEMGIHALSSLINVPVNTVAAACAFIASGIFASIFAVKVVICAMTDFDIPVPTYTQKSFNATIVMGNNVRLDLIDDAYDAAAALKMAAQALKINNLLAKVKELWDYIPRAYWA